MIRAVILVLAVAALGSGGASAAFAGDKAEHSGKHVVRTPASLHSTPQQRGTVAAEKRPVKQSAKIGRLFTHADKVSTKHRERLSRTDRPGGKQAILHHRQSDRASHAGPKHHSQIAAGEYRKLKRGTKVGHAAAKHTRVEKKQAGRRVVSNKKS